MTRLATPTPNTATRHDPRHGALHGAGAGGRPRGRRAQPTSGRSAPCSTRCSTGDAAVRRRVAGIDHRRDSEGHAARSFVAAAARAGRARSRRRHDASRRIQTSGGRAQAICAATQSGTSQLERLRLSARHARQSRTAAVAATGAVARDRVRAPASRSAGDTSRRHRSPRRSSSSTCSRPTTRCSARRRSRRRRSWRSRADGRQIALRRVEAPRRVADLRAIDRRSRGAALAGTDGASYPLLVSRWTVHRASSPDVSFGRSPSTAADPRSSAMRQPAVAARGIADGHHPVLGDAQHRPVADRGRPAASQSPASTLNRSSRPGGRTQLAAIPARRPPLSYYYQRCGETRSSGGVRRRARQFVAFTACPRGQRPGRLRVGLSRVRPGRCALRASVRSSEHSSRVGEAIRIADQHRLFQRVVRIQRDYRVAGGCVGVRSLGRHDDQPALDSPRRNAVRASRQSGRVQLRRRLSFDQKRVAVAITGPTMAERDIWVVDVARDAVSRVTFDPAADWFPAWSPDGARLYFGSTRLGITTIFQKAGVGEDEVVDRRCSRERAETLFASYPIDVSTTADRSRICQSGLTRGYDLSVMTLDDPKRTRIRSCPTPCQRRRPGAIRAEHDSMAAYASDESGQFEVYVRPYPTGNAQWKVSVSTAAARSRKWRRDGTRAVLSLRQQDDGGRHRHAPDVTDFGTSAPVRATPRVRQRADDTQLRRQTLTESSASSWRRTNERGDG